MNLLSGNPLLLEAAVFATLVGVLLLGAVVVFMLRTRSLPACSNCGFSSVRRAHRSHHPFDTLLRVVFLYPYRCQRCLRRSYCFGSSKLHRHSGHKTVAAGNAAR